MAYIERTINSISSTASALASTTQTIPLPREHLWSRLFIRMTIGNSTTLVFVAGGQNTFISNLAVILNGQLTIKSYPWLDLFNQNTYLHGATPDQTALTAAVTGGFSSNVIEFSLSPNSVSSLLPSHELSTFDLQIQFGAQAATLGGDAGVAVTIEFITREMVNEGQDSSNLFINKEVLVSLTPNATGETAASLLRLTIGNIFRRFYMRTSGGASAGDQNTTVTSITLRQDGVYSHRVATFLLLRVQDAVEYAVPVAERITGVAFLDLDLTEDLSQAVDSAPFSSWELVFNVPSVANAVTLRVIPQELIPPQ